MYFWLRAAVSAKARSHLSAHSTIPDVCNHFHVGRLETCKPSETGAAAWRIFWRRVKALLHHLSKMRNGNSWGIMGKSSLLFLKDKKRFLIKELDTWNLGSIYFRKSTRLRVWVLNAQKDVLNNNKTVIFWRLKEENLLQTYPFFCFSQRRSIFFW